MSSSITSIQEISSLELFVKKYRQRKGIKECTICYEPCWERPMQCCNMLICETCLSHLETFKCPFCRQSIDNYISDVVKDSIYVHNLVAKEHSDQKDHITSLYLQNHPTMSLDILYSALVFMDDPWVIMTMSPKEIANFIQTHHT
jgi:hypothetical protein